MTLTQAAILTKQAIIVSIVALVLGLSGFIGYKIWYAYYLAHLPPIEEKPDLKFGMLPVLNFPDSNVSTSNFSYSLDNITGGLPKTGIDPGFEKFIKVYFIPKTVITFLSAEKAQNLAEKFHLTAPVNVLSETKHQFKSPDKNLEVDIDTGNFSYTKEASISGNTTFNDDNRLISDFEQILTNLGVLNSNISSGRSKITYLKTSRNTFTPTPLLTEAEAALISLWPAAIDKKPILTADYTRSLINSIVTGNANDLDNYLSLDFTYYPIDTSTFATYPLKTGEIAFNDLQSGKGIVVVKPDKPQVSITSIYLGYYLEKTYTPYLQPIYIFEGPNFVAYVPAISEQYQSLAR